MPTMSIGERVTQARISKGISKAELARRTKLSNTAIGFLESGANKSIAGENVFPIADALNISARWLLTGKEPKSIDGQIALDHESAHVLQLARHLATLEEKKLQAVMVLLGVRQESTSSNTTS